MRTFWECQDIFPGQHNIKRLLVGSDLLEVLRLDLGLGSGQGWLRLGEVAGVSRTSMVF